MTDIEMYRVDRITNAIFFVRRFTAKERARAKAEARWETESREKNQGDFFILIQDGKEIFRPAKSTKLRIDCSVHV